MSRKKVKFPQIDEEKLRQAEDLEEAGWEAVGDEIISEPDYDRAESLFRKALELCPVLADAYNGLAHVAFNNNRLDDAEAYFYLAYLCARAELGTESIRAFYWWGNIHTRPYIRARRGLGLVYWRRGQYEEAIVQLQDLLRRNPSDRHGARYLIAPLYLLKGDVQSALREYELFDKKYSDDPSCPHFEFNRALALWMVGSKREAARALRNACFQNLYLAPLLLQRRVKTHPIWHGTNLAELPYAEDYLSLYGHLWQETEEAIDFLRRLWDDLELKREKRELIKLGKELQSLPPGEERHAILQELNALLYQRMLSNSALNRICG